MDQKEWNQLYDEVLENVKEIQRILIFLPRREDSK